MREDPNTEGTWGIDWLLRGESSNLGFGDMYADISPIYPRFPSFASGIGRTDPNATGGSTPFNLGTNQNTDMLTSGFSLSSLGGIFGGDGNQQNGMGDLYNFLLALNSGRGGANGTNLFSGIEV